METGEFDEGRFFAEVAARAVRALLIGRRALVALGLPVLTADYDYWVHFDDVERMNAAAATVGLLPDRTPAEARSAGRYVLENDEHVDVMIARSAGTVDGVRLAFDDAWGRRVDLRYSDEVAIAVPSLDDLILTKRWSARDRDVADIRLLESLRASGGG